MIAVRHLPLVVVLMWAVTPPAAPTQVAQLPARDGAQAPQEGSASISGRIIANDQSAQPVKRAILLLGGGGLVIPRQSTTTDDGQFMFAALPPGRFTLQAWRSGFVRDMYGNKRPGFGPGSAIVVAEGAHVAITMKMTRAAAISGTVLGLPSTVAGLRVMPFQFQRVDGERRLLPSFVGGVSPVAGGAAVVDDRGVYRLYGLPPGDYVVATTSFSSFTAGSDARAMTPEEVRWAQQQFGPRPPGAAPQPDPPASQPIAYASAYFPGTTDPAAAAVITLGPGEERAGVDFSLPLVSVARVAGAVTDASGQPPQSLQVTLRPMSELMSSLGVMSTVRTTPDGKFTATGVMPGRYVLVARGAFRVSAPEAAAAPAGRAGGPPLGPALWASVELTVDGRDLPDLALSLQPGATVTGRMVFDGAAPAEIPRLRFSLRPQTSQQTFEMAPAAVVNADGTFTMTGIAPGRYRFASFATIPPWSITSVTAGDREWLDDAIDIRPADAVTGVVVTVTNRPAGLSGRVIDETGSPTPNFFVVVFSTERRNWTSGSRRVAQARPDNTGGFSISTLPAGEYYVAALTDLDPSDLAEIGFLESLVAASIRVTLVPGEMKAQTLKVAGRH